MISERWLVILAYIIMIISNVISSTSNLYNHTNNTKISEENPTTITPDGITFAVWGPIYLFQLGLLSRQFWEKGTIFNAKMRLTIVVAFIANAVWLPIFAYQYWWLSLTIIITYLAALTEIYSIQMNINYADSRPWRTKVWAYTPISLNLAWITIATLLNITIVFRNSNIIVTKTQQQIIGGNTDWAVNAVVIATAIAIYKIFNATDIIYGLTTAWALLGIYRNQKEQQRIWAEICAIAIITLSIIQMAVVCIKRKTKLHTKLHTNLLQQSEQIA